VLLPNGRRARGRENRHGSSKRLLCSAIVASSGRFPAPFRSGRRPRLLRLWGDVGDVAAGHVDVGFCLGLVDVDRVGR
jgi:hypothetical protein